MKIKLLGISLKKLKFSYGNFSNGVKKNRGITLLVALTATSVLLLISFVVVNIATKQLVLGRSNQESQYAFYNADSGIDCALYWDLRTNGDPSPFDPYTPFPFAVTPRCNGSNFTFLATPGYVTIPQVTIVGGYSTTTFQVNLTKGCVIVNVVKKVGLATTTTVESRGYNTCVAGAFRKYERGIEILY